MTSIDLDLVRDLADRMTSLPAGGRLDAFRAALDWAEAAGMLEEAVEIRPGAAAATVKDDRNEPKRRVDPPLPVRSGPRGRFDPWTAAEDAVVGTMRADGTPFEEIAAHLGRSANAIQFRYYTKIRSCLREVASATQGRSEPAPPTPVRVPAAAEPPLPPPAGPLPAGSGSEAARPANLAREQRDAGTDCDGKAVWHKEMSVEAIGRHVAALPPAAGWTPPRDLELVQLILRGDGLGNAAEALGVDRNSALRRWKQLIPLTSITNQSHLLMVLKTRAEAA